MKSVILVIIFCLGAINGYTASAAYYEFIDGESNVREGPGTTFKVLFQPKKGAECEFISKKDQWYEVRFQDGMTGWAHRKNLKPWEKVDNAKKEIIEGVISEYGLGENYYLVIKDASGKEHTGLCAAPLCQKWNEASKMPDEFKGQKVKVTVLKEIKSEWSIGIDEFESIELLQYNPDANPPEGNSYCSEFEKDHVETMEKLAIAAKLPDGYFSRYHESVFSDLCSGDIKDVDKLVDDGYVEAKEAEDIAALLGKQYKAPHRSEKGKLYEKAYSTLLSLGNCTACASNNADEYVKNPNSVIGKLVKASIDGDMNAFKKLNEGDFDETEATTEENKNSQSHSGDGVVSHPIEFPDIKVKLKWTPKSRQKKATAIRR